MIRHGVPTNRVAFTWLARNFKQDCRIVSNITVSIPKLPLEPPPQDTAVDIVPELRTEQENAFQTIIGTRLPAVHDESSLLLIVNVNVN